MTFCVHLRVAVAVALQVAPVIQTSSDKNGEKSDGKKEVRRTPPNAFPANSHSLVVKQLSLFFFFCYRRLAAALRCY